MGDGTGKFSGKVTDLAANTTYYIRAYAISNLNTVYGTQFTFTTNPNPAGSFTDSRDNKTYKWVKIGNQVWMAENLAWLPVVSLPNAESLTTPYYYVYGYDGTEISAAKASANYATYGVLYNWPAAMNGAVSSSANPSGVQGACPAGWHLPGDAEWNTLTNYLVNCGYGYRGTADEIAKSLASSNNWNNSTLPGTPGNDPSKDNISGFSRLPGGNPTASSYFSGIGSYAYWWSSVEDSSTNSRVRYMNSYSRVVNQSNDWKECGFSVRCVKDTIQA